MVYFGLSACAAGGGGPAAVQVGNPSPVQSNMAAPMQESGTTTVKSDPDPEFSALYTVYFKEEGFILKGSGLLLKGSIQKNKTDAPGFKNSSLKIIDRRVKKYLIVPLETGESGNSNASAFSIYLEIPDLTFDELLGGKALNFFVIPTPSDAEASDDSAELKDCETPPCIDSVAGMALVFNPNGKEDVAPKLKYEPTPPAPGAPPKGGLEKPKGPLKMPGT